LTPSAPSEKTITRFATVSACKHQATESTFPVPSDERLVVLAGVLQVLTVPDGHQIITPTRRCHAPHLGASLALALRLNQTHPVYRHPEDIPVAEDLLAILDTDEQGPLGLVPRATGRPHPSHGRPQRAAALSIPAAPGLRRCDPGRPPPQPAPA
jgi:hypothetical protein